MRHFKAVCQYGSVGKAARAIFLSQPSISNSIKSLESELGVQLFERTNNSLILTKEGSFFLDRISGILDNVELLIQQMRDMQGHSASFSIGVTPLIHSSVLLQLLSFSQEQDNPGISIVEKETLDLFASLEREELDFGIVALMKDDFHPFQRLVLNQQVFTFCTAGEKDDSFSEEPIQVAFHKDPYVFEQEQSVLNKALKNCHVFLKSNNNEVVRELISHRNVRAFLSPQQFTSIKTVSAETTCHIIYNVELIWKRNRPLSKDASLFIECLTKASDLHRINDSSPIWRNSIG